MFSIPSGWKKMLRKRRVFGVAAPKKKSTSSVRPDQLHVPNQQTLSPSSATHSPTSSHDDPFFSDEESRNNNVKTEPQTSQPEHEGTDSKKSKPKLLSVVSSVKTLNCNNPRIFSDDEGAHEDSNIDEQKEPAQQGKKKGMRKRLSSWRSKKQRSASESDMMACEYEKEFQNNQDLREAWFADSSDKELRSKKPSTRPKKEHDVTIFDRKHSSPGHLPSRGYTISGDSRPSMSQRR